MKAEDEFKTIRQNARQMPDGEKIVFYQLKKKKGFVALLLSIFFFGGAGLLYAGKVTKGATISAIVIGLLMATVFVGGAGQVYVGDMSEKAQFVLLVAALLLYLHSIKSAHDLIAQYNENLHKAVFETIL